jgi:predicted metalloenzyme YecM
MALLLRKKPASYSSLYVFSSGQDLRAACSRENRLEVLMRPGLKLETSRKNGENEKLKPVEAVTWKMSTGKAVTWKATNES